MYQQEEKKSKIQGNTRINSLPLDLTSEILLRLPGRAVARSRCVSKQWLTITTDPCFTKLFRTRSSPGILLCFQAGEKMFFYSIRQYHLYSNESYYRSKTIERYHMRFPEEYMHFSPTESVHGLICFQNSVNLIVWNPSIGQLLTLRNPFYMDPIVLGYDPIEGKHKIVRLTRDCRECRVLTLGSAQETWRTIKTFRRFHSPNSCCSSYGRCINGIIYYKAVVNKSPVIMSFDVSSEKLDWIKLPVDTDIHMDGLIHFEGRLACVEKNLKDGITLLILEDAKKHTWLSKDFQAPFRHYDPSSKILSNLKGMTPAGEFVYVPDNFWEPFYVLFYDPVKNSFRKVESDEEVGDEFRINTGVLNGYGCKLHTFVNHIERVMFL